MITEDYLNYCEKVVEATNNLLTKAKEYRELREDLSKRKLDELLEILEPQ